jgi:hypothetical protein
VGGETQERDCSTGRGFVAPGDYDGLMVALTYKPDELNQTSGWPFQPPGSLDRSTKDPTTYST